METDTSARPDLFPAPYPVESAQTGPGAQLTHNAARIVANSLRGKLGDLTPMQRLFCLFYANPDNRSTYLNATRAYQAAYGTTEEKIQTASVNGSKSLANPKIQSEIELVLAGMGLAVGIRTMHVAAIATGAGRRTTIKTRKNAGGKVLHVDTIEAAPTFAEQLKANEILNRVTGANEAAKAIGDQTRRDLREATRDTRRLAQMAAKRRKDRGVPPPEIST